MKKEKVENQGMEIIIKNTRKNKNSWNRERKEHKKIELNIKKLLQHEHNWSMIHLLTSEKNETRSRDKNKFWPRLSQNSKP